MTITVQQGAQVVPVSDLDSCGPVEFQMNFATQDATANTNDTQTVPECKYYDEDAKEWRSDGCFLQDYNATTGTASCGIVSLSLRSLRCFSDRSRIRGIRISSFNYSFL
eukprot:UN26623